LRADTYNEIIKADPSAIVVISTGFADSERLDLVMNKGADGLLKKPYTIGELSAMPAKLLSEG